MGIDESLKKLGKVRLPTPSDGHCLLHTWSTGLSINKSRMEEVLVNELTEHYERYKHVICSGVDDISKFINEKKFNIDDSDFMINALCNGFNTDVVLYEVDKDDNIKVSVINPVTNDALQEIHVYFFQAHYELLSNLHVDDEYNTFETRTHSDNQDDDDDEGETMEVQSDDSDDGNDTNTPEEMEYLHGNMTLPIYSTEVNMPSFEHIVKILTNEDNSKICEDVPSRVLSSASFVVDISKLNNPTDVKCNDGEAMEHHGQKLRKVYHDGNGEFVIERTFSDDCDEPDAFFI